MYQITLLWYYFVPAFGLTGQYHACFIPIQLVLYVHNVWARTMGPNFVHSFLDGDDGMDKGKCFNRDESPPLNDPTKSLVLVNYFPTVPVKLTSCLQNSMGLNDMLKTCYDAAGHRWANFLAVNYYKVRSIILYK